MVIDCHYNKHFLNELYLEEKIQLSRFFVSSSYFPFEIYECQLITTLPGRIRKDLQENVLLLIFSCNYELHTSRSSVNFHFQWRRTQTIFSFVFISKWNSARLRCNKTALFSLSLSLSLRTIAMFSQILLLNLNRWLTEWHNKTWWRIETTNHSNTHKEVPRTEIHVQELFTLEKIDEKKVELRAVVVVGRLYTIVARLMCASWARPSFTWCKSIKNFENDWK